MEILMSTFASYNPLPHHALIYRIRLHCRWKEMTSYPISWHMNTRFMAGPSLNNWFCNFRKYTPRWPKLTEWFCKSAFFEWIWVGTNTKEPPLEIDTSFGTHHLVVRSGSTVRDAAQFEADWPWENQDSTTSWEPSFNLWPSHLRTPSSTFTLMGMFRRKFEIVSSR